jgi:hypothetical protein
MKKSVRFYAGRLALFLLALFFMVGCGSTAGGGETVPTQQQVVVDSPEAQYLLGKWIVNQGRFGHKIFDFQADGRLSIEDVDTDQTINMSYVFVGENSIALSGYEEFDGAATVNFYENKLDFTINFNGTIYGELYSFTRVD